MKYASIEDMDKTTELAEYQVEGLPVKNKSSHFFQKAVLVVGCLVLIFSLSLNIFLLIQNKFALTRVIQNNLNNGDFKNVDNTADLKEQPQLFPTTSPNDISDQINLGRDTYEILEIEPGINKLISQEADFSLVYPSYLKVYDYTSDRERMGRQIFLCETEIFKRSDVHYQKCPAGMMVWYDGDGWGGGCNQEFKSTIKYRNKEVSFCQTGDSFGQLYLKEDNGLHNYLIEGRYSSAFTPSVSEQIIQSIDLDLME